MNDVERSLVRDGLLDQSSVDVELPRERFDESVNLIPVELRDEVRVLREPGEAMRRAGKRPYEHGWNAQLFQI